jgi:hypothetical protein
VNWLEIKFLRAAAALSAQSSRRLHSQSMAPHRGGTHQYESAVSPPSSEGSAPLNWLLFIALRAAAAEKRPQHCPPAAASLSPWHLTEGHSQCLQLRERAQL